MSTTAKSTGPASEYARLLVKLHELDPNGKVESPEQDSVCAQMDRPWVQMSGPDRKRMKGLSSDLYALADGRRGVEMSQSDRKQWGKEANDVLPSIFAGGNVDPVLHFLRQPYPSDMPADTIPFLQARCWERLGEQGVALIFMKEAARINPRQLVCVLMILQRLGRAEEETDYAQRIVQDKGSTSEELFQAAATLVRPARQMKSADARPIFEEVVTILKRALRVFHTTPKQKREIPDTDRDIIEMLGLCHRELGNAETAVELYSDAIARYPRDASLLTSRGFAWLDIDFDKALNDFKRAALAGPLLMWPYYFLAWHALVQHDYFETWKLCLRALELTGGSNHEAAQVHEWLGIALAESGQSMTWALENFDRALSLDPDNRRIQHNRAVAERRRTAPTAEIGNGWQLSARPSPEQAQRKVYTEDQPTPDLFSERTDAKVAALVGVAG